jgi:hypothetical protein
MYLPTAFAFTVPFAMLPFEPAHVLWLTMTAASLVLAAFHTWNLGADHAPVASGVLVFLIVANSENLLFLGETGRHRCFPLRGYSLVFSQRAVCHGRCLLPRNQSRRESPQRGVDLALFLARGRSTQKASIADPHSNCSPKRPNGLVDRARFPSLDDGLAIQPVFTIGAWKPQRSWPRDIRR